MGNAKSQKMIHRNLFLLRQRDRGLLKESFFSFYWIKLKKWTLLIFCDKRILVNLSIELKEPEISPVIS